jgi:phosphatidylglycerophosphate synthase
MLDRPLRRLLDPGLEMLAGTLAARGISANACTLTGFTLGMVGCVAIAFQQYSTGLAFILANRLADGLDGCIARRSRTTDVGGFLDFVLDVLFYGGVPVAFAVAQPKALWPACFLTYSFLGTTGSFLAFAAIAAKRGVTSDQEGRKSFFYSVGLMEGTETVLFFALFCLFPHRFATLAWIFGGLCWATVACRIISGIVAFQERSNPVAEPPQPSSEHTQ